MGHRLAAAAAAVAVVSLAPSGSGLAAPSLQAGDGGSGTFTTSGRSAYFDLFNAGTAAWQAFVVVAPAGAAFVGGATAGESTARCVPGQPDGLPNEIECGPLSATAVASHGHLSFAATLAAAPACGDVFKLEVTSTGVGSFTPAGDLTRADACPAGPARALEAPRVHGTPKVGSSLTATPARWSEAPSRVDYRWQRCAQDRCTAIPGATTLRLRLTPVDAGRRVRMVATAVIAGARVVSRSREVAVRAGGR